MPCSSKAVIILEDDTDISDLLAQLIASCGAMPVICQNLEGVMRASREHQVALALLDIMLPATDGREVLRCMKDGGVDFPVYLMTGVNTSNIGEEYCRLATGILKKPFSIVQLRSLLASHLALEGETCKGIFRRQILEMMAAVASEQENVRRLQARLSGLTGSSAHGDSAAMTEQFKEFAIGMEATLSRLSSRLDEIRELLEQKS